MSAAYEDRATYVIDVPLPEGLEVLHPELLVLRFAHGPSIDIGALCYLDRAEDQRKANRPHEGTKVVHSTLNIGRLKQVSRLISNVSEALRDTGARPETIRDRYSRFVAFMAWADRAGLSTVLDDKEAARVAFREYVAFLWDRVGRNQITVNSGFSQQSNVLQVLEALLDAEDLDRGINLLRTSRLAKESTSPPADAVKGRVLALCESLFNGLGPIALEGAPYPYSLGLPEYLKFPENRQWLFPTTSWFITSAMDEGRRDSSRRGWGYNFQDGRLATLDELRDIPCFAGESDAMRLQVLRRSESQMRAANENWRHSSRCAAARQAMNVFTAMFLSQTGMNWAQLTALGWSDDYQVEPSNQGFRTVKSRAGGKTVSFELPIAFMPAFKRYLDFRKFLLAGQDFDHLFFSAGRYGTDAPRKIASSGMDSTYLMLRRLDPGLPAITSREWRAAKSDWLVRNTDVSTAALVLQNSEATVMQAYAEGSETTAIQEMGDFLDGVSTTVLARGTELPGAVERALGKCEKFGEPMPGLANAAIKPDCGGPEGCLFCDKFKVHADEVDTRKLASCRHCLRVVGALAGDEARQDVVLKPVLSRIDSLLQDLSNRDAEMVTRVVREVDEEGELDVFWARKLDMLMELGLVA